MMDGGDDSGDGQRDDGRANARRAPMVSEMSSAPDQPGRVRNGPGAAHRGQLSMSSDTVPQSRQSTR